MKLALVPVLLLFVATSPRAEDPTPVADALERAGENRPQIEAALAAFEGEERRGMEFLVANMPEVDLQSLTSELLIENVREAYAVRARVPWASSVPEDVFLNDVLPYAHVSERRDAWRAEFVERFLPVVADCETAAEAAQRLNEKVFGMVGVRYSTQRRRADQSAHESMEIGMASCTGLSIILGNACRAVGVPARLAGVASWVDKRGNHTWVEVWDGEWHFTGAAEPSSAGLNHAWFERDASRAIEDDPRHAVWAVSYRRTGTPFPMVWSRRGPRVSGVNVTSHYTDASDEAAADEAASIRLHVRVWDEEGGERVAATVLVSDTEDEAWAKSGQSRDESADTNDMLSFEIRGGRTYEVFVIAPGGETIRRRVETGADGDTTFDVALAAGAAAPSESDEAQAKAKAEAKSTAAGVIQLLAPAPTASCEPGEMALTKADRAAFSRAAKAWFEAPADERDAVELDARFDAHLTTAKGDEELRDLAWKAYREADVHAELRAELEANVARAGGYESPYTVKEVGEKPARGWPLFIAMHGGGGVPKRVNDSQWEVMKRYYRDHPELGGYLYVALRAPTDEWNGFYTDYMYPVVERLLAQFTVLRDVDPDKVFIMGYSHGGYGAFAIGPKLPHRFAAVHASAAAPTDGQTSAKTLRNTRFTYMIGERDTRYGRLERCQAFDAEIAALKGDRKDIYPVTMEYQPGHGHGGLPDRDKITDMYPHVRNPVPRTLVWEQTDGVCDDFFWVETAAPERGGELVVSSSDNVIEWSAEGVSSFRLLLDARLVDLAKPVEVRGGGVTAKLDLEPSVETLLATLEARADPGLAATVIVDAPPTTAERDEAATASEAATESTAGE